MLRTLPGGRASLALPLEALAQIAVATGQPLIALRLAGAAAAGRQASGVPKAPSQRAQLERWLARARQELGESAANAAWLAGQLLTREEALAQVRAMEPSS